MTSENLTAKGYMEVDGVFVRQTAPRMPIPAPQKPITGVLRAKEGQDSQKRSKPSRNGYSKEVVLAYFTEMGLPEPEFEYRFHPLRKWRMDIAWPLDHLFIEVNGGIFIQGAHSRGAQTLKDWEKWNEAVCLRWKPLFFQPKDLCTEATVNLIKRALGMNK